MADINDMARLVFRRYMDGKRELAGLPELRGIICEHAPDAIVEHVVVLLSEYVSQTGSFDVNIAGFVTFRLKPISCEIDSYVNRVINMVLARGGAVVL